MGSSRFPVVKGRTGSNAGDGWHIGLSEAEFLVWWRPGWSLLSPVDRTVTIQSLGTVMSNSVRPLSIHRTTHELSFAGVGPTEAASARARLLKNPSA